MLPAAVLAGGYALLLAAWVFGNPPFRGPDEAAHYVRAVGLAGGQLVGRPARVELPPDADPTAVAIAKWSQPFTRSFVVPAGHSPAGWLCAIDEPQRSAACLDAVVPSAAPSREVTYVGTYPPLPYALSGALARAAPEAARGVRLGRVGAALLCLGLVVLGVAALAWHTAPAPALAGAALALTPMAIFLAASLNPSGLEVAAAFAFAASLLQLTRGGAHRAPWALAGASAAVLAVARPPGPLWVVLIAGLAAAAAPPGVLRRRLGAERRAALLVVGAFLAAVAANRAWAALFASPAGVGAADDPSASRDAFVGFSWTVLQQIGAFNQLEFALPFALYGLWWSLLSVLGGLALLAGTRRERATLAAAIVGALLLPPAISVLYGGFGTQGRYVLPFSLVCALLAGEIVLRRRTRLADLPVGALAVALVAGAAVVQAAAWYVNARRFAVGLGGPLWFPGRAEWTPPLGWGPWLLLAAAGALLLITGIALAVRRERPAADAT